MHIEDKELDRVKAGAKIHASKVKERPILAHFPCVDQPLVLEPIPGIGIGCHRHESQNLAFFDRGIRGWADGLERWGNIIGKQRLEAAWTSIRRQDL